MKHKLFLFLALLLLTSCQSNSSKNILADNETDQSYTTSSYISPDSLGNESTRNDAINQRKIYSHLTYIIHKDTYDKLTIEDTKSNLSKILEKYKTGDFTQDLDFSKNVDITYSGSIATFIYSADTSWGLDIGVYPGMKKDEVVKLIPYELEVYKRLYEKNSAPNDELDHISILLNKKYELVETEEQDSEITYVVGIDFIGNTVRNVGIMVME